MTFFGFLIPFVLSGLHLLAILSDLICTFILARLLLSRWRPVWLVQLNQVGTPLIDYLTTELQQRCRLQWKWFQLWFLLLLFTASRVLVQCLAQLVIRLG